MPDDPVVIQSRGRTFTRRDVLDAADFRSDIEPLRQSIRLALAAQEYAADEGFETDFDAIQAEAEAYRVDRDLSTAEDTERWLAEHALTIEDFTLWLERRAWLARFADRLEGLLAEYHPAAEEVESLVWAEVVFGDHLPALTRSLAARAAALVERPGSWAGGPWAEELAEMERAYGDLRAEVLQPTSMNRELDVRRSLLMRFRAELAVFPSRDAGREAWLCVTRGGEAFGAVAEAAGAEVRTVEWFLEEFPESLRGLVLSAAAGETLPPAEDGEGFLVCRVIEKRLPETADDPAVRGRIESILMERTVDGLLHKHITIVATGG